MPAAAAIVIPNYNGARFLPPLFESLHRQSRRDFEVIVVDDASGDGGADWLRAARPDVRLIVNPHNVGFAATCNAGLRAADAPVVALLNNDTTVDPRWFERALHRFDDPRVGSVASLVLRADPPHPIDSAGDVFSVAGGASKRLHGAPAARAAELPADTFSACAASAFYRRAALDRVGLLDEQFVSYYEDVELGFRLQWAGWRCVLAADSICYHRLSASHDPRGWTMHFHSARNAEIVWRALLTARQRRRYLAAHLAFLTLQCAAETLRGRGRPFLAGKWAALRAGDWVRDKRAAVARLARVSEAELNARLERRWWRLHVAPRLAKLLRGTWR